MTTFELNARLAIRVLVFILVITLGTFFLFAGAKSALAATLRSSTLVHNQSLTVGDIFEGISEEKAKYVLGPAPYPGKDLTLNAHTLLRVALTVDLPWRPQSSADQIVIRRAATLIDQEMIETKLSTQLMDKGIADDFDLTFHTSNIQMVLPPDIAPEFDITNLRYDPARGIFEAVLRAPSDERALTELFVSGKLNRVIKVPVLKETVRQNDVIRSSDILWVDMHDDNIQHDILLTEEDILGMTPRRMITAGKPIRSQELALPQVIKRGDTVTITYQTGPIFLTVSGKALENGAKNDLIRVVNTSSSRPIDAFVTGDGMVTVSN